MPRIACGSLDMSTQGESSDMVFVDINDILMIMRVETSFV